MFSCWPAFKMWLSTFSSRLIIRLHDLENGTWSQNLRWTGKAQETVLRPNLKISFKEPMSKTLTDIDSVTSVSRKVHKSVSEKQPPKVLKYSFVHFSLLEKNDPCPFGLKLISTEGHVLCFQWKMVRVTEMGMNGYICNEKGQGHWNWY